MLSVLSSYDQTICPCGLLGVCPRPKRNPENPSPVREGGPRLLTLPVPLALLHTSTHHTTSLYPIHTQPSAPKAQSSPTHKHHTLCLPPMYHNIHISLPSRLNTHFRIHPTPPSLVYKFSNKWTTLCNLTFCRTNLSCPVQTLLLIATPHAISAVQAVQSLQTVC